MTRTAGPRNTRSHTVPKWRQTSDHSRLQARFLEDRFCLGLLSILYPKAKDVPLNPGPELGGLYDMFEHKRRRRLDELRAFGSEEDKKEIPAISAFSVALDLRAIEVNKIVRDFASDNVDVFLCFSRGYSIPPTAFSGTFEAMRHWRVQIECKPELSDDHSDVIRHMRSLPPWDCDRVVLASSFTGQGATLEQVREIFGLSGIRILLENEVNRAASSLGERSCTVR